MAINLVESASFAKKVLNSRKNFIGTKPRININLGGVDKFIYQTQSLKNPATNNIVATVPSDLPPLKEGWVRLIHRTEPVYTKAILNEGLRGKYGISGTTSVHDAENFWKNLKTDNGAFHGSKKIVMDLPAKEYRKLYLGDNYYKKESIINDTGYKNASNLYVKNKYIVGILDAYGSRKHMTPKQLASMKQSSELNPFLEIKPEDLRQLNLGRPKNRDWLNRTPSQARKEVEKLQKEIAKNEAETLKKPVVQNIEAADSWSDW